MRISTSMIFDAGVSGINQQMATALHLQEEVSSGKRVVRPSDDPVAAAQAVQVQQAQDINTQLATNQDNAKSALGIEDTNLSTANDLLTRVRELAVQAGSSTLTSANRQAIATELRTDYDQLMGIANATDGTGQYLFSGYKGQTQPFAGTVDDLNASPATDITYQGDDGQRRLQITPSRYLEVSDSGNAVFKRIGAGNGYFTTGYVAGNTGTGVVSPGTVTDPTAWSGSSKNFQVQFSVVAGTTYYDVINMATNTSILGAPVAYQSGQQISFAGASFSITGTPAAGDKFSVQGSSSQSVFKTIANVIGALERPVSGAASQANYQTDISAALVNIDQASSNIMRVRTGIGSRENEVTSTATMNGDLKLQYASTLSTLTDVDAVKALSDLTLAQTNLDAAEKSFKAVSGLSLFNYL